jgi:Flp pilus assembly protein TadD
MVRSGSEKLHQVSTLHREEAARAIDRAVIYMRAGEFDRARQLFFEAIKFHRRGESVEAVLRAALKKSPSQGA